MRCNFTSLFLSTLLNHAQHFSDMPNEEIEHSIRNTCIPLHRITPDNTTLNVVRVCVMKTGASAHIKCTHLYGNCWATWCRKVIIPEGGWKHTNFWPYNLGKAKWCSTYMREPLALNTIKGEQMFDIVIYFLCKWVFSNVTDVLKV